MADSIPRLRPPEIKELLREAIRNPGNFPSIFVWGGPGIGKSEVCSQAAREEEVSLLDIRALLTDPTDWRGIPYFKDGKAIWAPPSFLPTEGRGIMFLDELPLAPPLTQNSILQLVLDRRLAEYELPDGWCIVAAGNRETETIGSYKMPPPLRNRFIHVEFAILDESGHPFMDDQTGISNPDWVKWAILSNIHPTIIGLLSKFRPELIYKFDFNKNAFPTPRAWEFVSRILNSGLPEGLKLKTAEGAVGQGAIIELTAYMKVWNQVPDLNKILKGEDLIPEKIDVLYATCTGLVSKAKEVASYSRLIDYALKLPREFTIFMSKMLRDKDPQKMQSAKSWPELAKTLVRKEGILPL